MIETFQAWIDNPQEYARNWKKNTGGKVMGVFGVWAPEEILVAADLLPWPIRQTQSPETARYEFLDGVCGPPGDQTVGLPGAGARRFDLPPLPDRKDPEGQARFAAQLADFKKSLEDWTGKHLATGDLDRGIAALNGQRRLLRAVWETRKTEPSPLTGLEAFYLAGSGQSVDKGEYARVLREVLEKELPGRRPPGGSRRRLMLLGGEARTAEWLGLLEALEAVVVIDDRDCAIRDFRNEVLPAEDRLGAIAARYLERSPAGNPDHVLQLARDWRVQGAVILSEADRGGQESNLNVLPGHLEGLGVPSLVLDPAGDQPLSRWKIRVESFLEALRPEDLF